MIDTPTVRQTRPVEEAKSSVVTSALLRACISLLLFAALSFYVPISVGAVELFRRGFSFYDIVPVLITLLFGALIARDFYLSVVEPMKLAYRVFTYFFFGASPIAQLSTLDWPQLYRPQANDLILASAIVLVGTIFWEIGYHFPVARKSYSVLELSRRKVRVGAATAAFFSLLYGIAVLPALFSSREDLSDRAESVFGTLTSTGNIAIALGTVPIVVICIAWSSLLDSRGFGTFDLTILILLALTVSNPASSPRFWVGTVVLAFMLAVGRGGGAPFRVRALILTLVVGFVVIFPWASILFRYSEPNSSAPSSLGTLTEQLVGEDFDSYQQVATGTVFVHDKGFQGGQQLLASALFFVPRDLWASKPYGTGEEIAKWSGYQFTNLSAPIWLEGYVDFGFAGVVLFGLSIGYFSRRLDCSYTAGLGIRGPTLWKAFVPVLAFYQLLALRGPLLVVMPRLAVLVLAVVVLVQFKPSNREVEN